jgi:hypothetical protein
MKIAILIGAKIQSRSSQNLQKKCDLLLDPCLGFGFIAYHFGRLGSHINNIKGRLKASCRGSLPSFRTKPLLLGLGIP